MSNTLDGVLVVSLEQAVAAPLATSRMADAGARIIKIERHEGDFARGYDDYVHGQSSYFVWLNRGKQSCRVDLKSPGDIALVKAMLQKAQVFVQNLAPGACDRLGLGATTLLEEYPSLICCDIIGYPPGSPDAARKAYDLLVQAESGLSGITGSEEAGPSRVGVSICDIATGQAAYAAILEALIRRRETGKGCHIQVSLFATMAEYMNVPYLSYRYGGIEPRRLGLSHPSIAPYGAFELADGQVVISIQSDREWVQLCEQILHDPALANDPRFRTNVQRVRNRAACDERVQAVLARRTKREIAAEFDKAKIAYGFISTMADLTAHPASAMLDVSLPGGTVEILAPPVIVDGQRRGRTTVPAIGEHDALIREEFLPSSSLIKAIG